MLAAKMAAMRPWASPCTRAAIHRGLKAGVNGGYPPFSGRRPQKRAEGLSGGAGNRCYGKYESLAGIKKRVVGEIILKSIKLWLQLNCESKVLIREVVT